MHNSLSVERNRDKGRALGTDNTFIPKAEERRKLSRREILIEKC